MPEVVRLLTEGLRGEELLIEAETTAKSRRNERRQNPDSLSQIDDGSGRISECRQDLEGESDV